MVYDNRLTLSVKDFGPVAEAEFDLRPMTVFVGPSNTGKSYLAILVYVLHQFFGGSVDTFPFRRSASHLSASLSQGDDVVRDSAVEDMLTWLEQAESHETPDDFQAPMPDSVASIVLSTLPISQDVGDLCVNEILRCFGRDSAGRLVRYGSPKEARVLVSSKAAGEGKSELVLRHEFVLGKNNESAFHSSVPNKIPIEIATRACLAASSYRQRRPRFRIPGFSDDDRLASTLLGFVSGLVGSWLVKPLNEDVHYLPADRTGIMHAHKVVVRSLVRSTSRAALQHEDPLPVLSGVTADFLDTLIGLEEMEDEELSIGRDLAIQLEKKILAGSIATHFSPIGYPEFYYRPSGWNEDIPLMNTSSMISELAPVALYLHNVVNENELLIIEEPESHLHPAMQVEFVRHLAAAVRAGIRVLITTHSEWVLEELANLVHLSNLPESQRDGIGGADTALTPDQLGIWLFGPDKESGGSIVEEIRFSAEDGGFVTDYEDVAIRTHNDWARISNRLTEIDTE